ncbi:diol dehydratase small subunit, partial [Halanaerobium sp.]
KVDDDRILEIYNAMRPYRSTKAELIEIAEELENDYDAVINANLIREAADVYEKRERLKGDR